MTLNIVHQDNYGRTAAASVERCSHLVTVDERGFPGGVCGKKKALVEPAPLKEFPQINGGDGPLPCQAVRDQREPPWTARELQ
jgi:hypothetical protein